MKFVFLLSLGAASVLAMACSVSPQSVENKPPVIDHNAQVFSMTYGPYKLTAATAFLWPQGLNEDQIANLVMNVNGVSMTMDPILAKLGVLLRESDTLKDQWVSPVNCVKQYAVLGPGDDPDVGVDHVSQWKVPDPSNPNSVAELQKCQANQARRDQIPAETAALNLQLAPKLDAINKMIDPDQSHVVNGKSLDFLTSNLAITKTGSGTTKVSVKLGKFLIPGYAPSTEGANPQIANASYDEYLRLLSFDVPEVDSTPHADGTLQMTGNVYRFRLERGPNVGPLASFRGDMNLYDSTGKILRYGTARIDGFPPQ